MAEHVHFDKAQVLRAFDRAQAEVSAVIANDPAVVVTRRSTAAMPGGRA